MASVPRERMGPPPRSLATDAHDCIMVRMLQASTEYKVVGQCSPNDGRLASDCLVHCCAGRPPPPWTRDGRSASADRHTNQQRTEQMETGACANFTLDNKSPIQGLHRAGRAEIAR